MAAQGLADKYPAVAELAGQATHLAGFTKRIFVLYVEGGGLIPPAGDLVEGIWFGADVKGGCVELSDRTGAGMGFLEVLKEAVPSGNVSVAHMESRWMEGLKAK